MANKTISPEESKKLFPDKIAVVTRVKDGQQFFLQEDGKYVMWLEDLKTKGK